MDSAWRTVVWQQFGAAIDMLDDALLACPDHLWREPVWNHQPEYAQFWNVAAHALFWLDFYLTRPPEGFVPPPPITLDELDPAGAVPARPYTRDELRAYLKHGREKCRTTIEALTDEQAREPYRLSSGEVSFAELLLYSMRHVQEHAAQLNLLLGQKIGFSPGWVAKARNEPAGE